MTEVCKMIQGTDKVNLGKLFCKMSMEEQENSLCLKIRRYVNSNIGLNFFTRRVVNSWNRIPDIVVGYKSLCTFKMKLDEFITAKSVI